MMRSLLTASALLRPPATQAVQQADIQLQTLDLAAAGDLVTIRVVVSTDNTGTARNAVLHVLLPMGAKVVRVPPGCRPSASPTGVNTARVDCDLGEMRVRDLREVAIVTTTLPGMPRRFGAFVFSDTPDPEPTNNYAARIWP